LLAFTLFETWVAVSANLFDLAMRPMTSCIDRMTKQPPAVPTNVVTLRG
jgi:hypothetical protein